MEPTGNILTSGVSWWTLNSFRAQLWLVLLLRGRLSLYDALYQQAAFETGHFASRGFNVRSSPWGMHASTQRARWWSSKDGNYAVYPNFYQAICDRLDWDKVFYPTAPTEGFSYWKQFPSDRWFGSAYTPAKALAYTSAISSMMTTPFLTKLKSLGYTVLWLSLLLAVVLLLYYGYKLWKGLKS